MWIHDEKNVEAAADAVKRPLSAIRSARRGFMTVAILPLQLHVGDRLDDANGEWEVIGGPWSMAAGKPPKSAAEVEPPAVAAATAATVQPEPGPPANLRVGEPRKQLTPVKTMTPSELKPSTRASTRSTGTSRWSQPEELTDFRVLHRGNPFKNANSMICH